MKKKLLMLTGVASTLILVGCTQTERRFEYYQGAVILDKDNGDLWKVEKNRQGEYYTTKIPRKDK